MKLIPKHLSISSAYNKPYEKIIADFYALPLSVYEISEKILAETNIYISSRSVLRCLFKIGVTRRTKSESYRLAIKKQRRTYTRKESV